MKKKISMVLLASVIGSNITPALNVFADEVLKEQAEVIVENAVNNAKISKFDLKESESFEKYNSQYKVQKEDILSISNNGGKYGSSTIDKAIDGDMSTHWETGKENNSSFTNEVVVEFDNIEKIDRIAYATRQDGAKGKGYPTKFEIHASVTGNDEDLKLVSQGTSSSTGNMMEFKFDTITAKKIKFVFVEANQNWASASEFWFYREDKILDRINRMFTDSNMNQISEEFNTIEKLSAFEEEAKNHVLYQSEFSEKIEHAKILIEDNKIETGNVSVSEVVLYDKEQVKEYNEIYKMNNSNIKSITNNGGQYASSSIDKAIDSNLNTFWETGNANTSTFKNEVVFELKESTELNRILYATRQDGARGKGFPLEFEIYGTNTSKGDNFKLISNGKYKSTGNLVEFKFNPTKLKRIKFVFKNASEDWASASEFMFYKEDKIADNFPNLFEDGTCTRVKEEYNTLEKLNEIEDTLKDYPMKWHYMKSINLAKELIQDTNKYDSTIVELEQRGNPAVESSKRKLAQSLQDLQVTGLSAKPGDTLQVYVDIDNDESLPVLSYGQNHDRSRSTLDFTLKQGINTIVIPDKDYELIEGTPKGGAIYFKNYYTEKEQGKAPKIRVVGASTYPVYIEGKSNDSKVMKELEEYAKKVEQDSNLMNKFSVSTDKALVSVTATEAIRWYKENDKLPSYTAKRWNELVDYSFDFYGFDNSSQVNSRFNSRVMADVRKMPEGHFLNASGGGIAVGTWGQGSVLGGDRGWGISHELGHIIDNNVKVIGELTNNILPTYIGSLETGTTRITTDDIWERTVYTKVYKEDYSENKMPDGNGDSLQQLAPLWQLHMYYDNFYPKFEQAYRTGEFNLKTTDEKKQSWVKVSSDVLKLNLVEFFARHGIHVSDDVKVELEKYPKPDKKLYYLNDKSLRYEGNGLENINTPNAELSKVNGNSVKLELSIDKEYESDFLGYEIYRDGEIVGFTSKSSFVDNDVDTSVNHEYSVVGYDRKLNELNPVKLNTFAPILNIRECVTTKINSEFNPMDYVRAVSYSGKDITDKITIKSNNIDLTKQGNYQVEFEVLDNNYKTLKTLEVKVVSSYDYLSDSKWKGVETQWGTPRKNSNIKGRVNGEIKTFEKGFGIHANGKIVYDLSDYDYDTFEALLGVDMDLSSQENSSITFKVVGDGKTLATTKVIKHADDMIGISVPVSGVKELAIEINDGGNGNTSDHAVIANPILTTNNSKPTIEVSKLDDITKLGNEYDLMEGISAKDIEDGDLTQNIKVNTNGFDINKSGRYNIEYTVTDSDNNTRTVSRDIVVYSNSIYISDIDWKSAQTDWQSVRKDKSVSNGTIKIGIDGDTTEFKKGIGTHANSTIIYDVEGKGYEYFETFVGIDRNISQQDNSSVIFEIYADGEKVYDSGLMRWSDDAKLARINLNGVRELKLVANNGGNGNSSDHANFADAKFLITNSKPKINIASKKVSTKLGLPIELDNEYTAVDAEDGDLTNIVVVSDNVNFDKAGNYKQTFTVTDSDGNTSTVTRDISVVDMKDFTYLSDINWKSGNAGSALRKDVSTGNTPMRLLGEDKEVANYTKGIGTHSYSTIIYDLSNENYDYFSSFIGIDRQMINRESSVEFKVYLDGKEAYDSGLVEANDVKKYLELNITGVKELKLVVTDYDGTRGADWANWADAKLYYAVDGEEVNKIDLDKLVDKVKKLKESNYTAESYALVKESLSYVEDSKKDGYNQEEIDTLYDKLKQAYDNLEKLANFEELEKIIKENSEYNELHYFAEPIKVHKALIEEAKEMIKSDDVSQVEIDDMCEKILESAKNLIIRKNKVELGKVIEKASAMENDNYNPDRWESFKDGLVDAKEVYNDINATDSDVESFTYLINYLISELK